MPNPLTDKLSDEAKAELAAIFADLKIHYRPIDPEFVVKANRIMARGRRPWELR
jgi:hypothetical protein